MPKEKIVDAQISQVISLRSSLECVIISAEEPEHSYDATLSPLNSGYQILTQDRRAFPQDYGRHFDLRARFADNTFTFRRCLHSHERSAYGDEPDSAHYEIACNSTNFSSAGFDKDQPYSYRLILPLDESLNWAWIIDSSNFTIKDKTHCKGLSVELDGILFDLYPHTASDKKFLLIDSEAQLSWIDFHGATFSILLTLGWLTGYFPQGHGYFFAFTGSVNEVHAHLHYSALMNSKRSGLIPLTSNACSIKHLIDKEIHIKSIHDRLKRLTQDEFSCLCGMVKQNQTIMHCILLLLEGNGLSLHLMAGAYAIALEAMTTFVSSIDSNRLKPIQDHRQARLFRENLHAVLEEFDFDPATVSISTLKKNIDKINDPTNRDKLIMPFKLLGISLSDVDKKAIGSRNDFLHGRISTKNISDITEGEDHSILNEETLNVLHIVWRFYTLVSALILKQCGFSGFIINHPKVHEKFLGIALEENYFREI